MLPATSLIPIHDQNPVRSFSLVSVTLIAINVVALFMTPSLGMGSSERLAEFFYTWGTVPWEITHGQPVSLSGCEGACVPGKNVYVSLITSMFLHGGILHIAGNMLFLYVFGNNIEDVLGKVKYLLFYLAAGIVAALAHVYTNSDSLIPTVGASGAVSGLLGAYIVLYPRARVTSILPLFVIVTTVNLPAFVVLGIWFASQFFIDVGQQGGSGVAWMAHVGGFLAGIVFILPFRGRVARRREPADYGTA